MIRKASEEDKVGGKGQRQLYSVCERELGLLESKLADEEE